MKRIFLFFAAAFLLAAFPANAQGPYGGIGVSFGVPVGVTVLGENHESDNVSNSFSNENVVGSYGKGLTFQGYFGDMMSDNVGLELGVNYLLGGKYKFTDHSIQSPNVNDNTVDEVFARSLRLIPAVRFSVGTGSLRPYVRAGLAIGVMNKIIDNRTDDFTNPSGAHKQESTFEYKGGLPIGLAGGLGFTYSFSDNLAFFGELSTFNMSWAPKKGEFTMATTDGADDLGSMTTSQKQYEFVNKVDQSMNNNASSPTQELKSYFPLSSVGIMIGLHFGFGG